MKAKTLTESEAAKQIGISLGTLSRFRRSGQVPSWRQIGRRILYTPEDVERFLAARRRGEIVDVNERRVLEARFG